MHDHVLYPKSLGWLYKLICKSIYLTIITSNTQQDNGDLLTKYIIKIIYVLKISKLFHTISNVIK